MKRYLRETEIAGMILLLIGTVVGRAHNVNMGAAINIVGLALWIITVVIKAFNWKEYRRDNMVNIVIMIGATLILLFFLVRM